MFKSEARGVRGKHQAEWDLRYAWGNEADDDGAGGEPQQQTMSEAEMWAVWQKQARRFRLKQREERDKVEQR